MELELIMIALQLDNVVEIMNHIMTEGRVREMGEHMAVVTSRTRQLLLKHSNYHPMLATAYKLEDQRWAIAKTLEKAHTLAEFTEAVHDLVISEGPGYLKRAKPGSWWGDICINTYQAYIGWLTSIRIDSIEELILVKKAIFYIMLVQSTKEWYKEKEMYRAGNSI